VGDEPKLHALLNQFCVCRALMHFGGTGNGLSIGPESAISEEQEAIHNS
jgi:hypothetical protein